MRYDNGHLITRILSTASKRIPHEDAPRIAAFIPDVILQYASVEITSDSKIDFRTQILNTRKGMDRAQRRKSDRARFIISTCVIRRNVLLRYNANSILRFAIDPNNPIIPKRVRNTMSKGVGSVPCDSPIFVADARLRLINLIQSISSLLFQYSFLLH